MAIEGAPPQLEDAGRGSPSGTARRSELTAETRYRLLLEISHRTRGTLDLERILNLLLDSLAEHLSFDAAGIFVLRQAIARSRVASLGERIAGVTWRGFEPRSARNDPLLRGGRGIVGHVIENGEQGVGRDSQAGPYYDGCVE